MLAFDWRSARSRSGFMRKQSGVLGLALKWWKIGGKATDSCAQKPELRTTSVFSFRGPVCKLGDLARVYGQVVRQFYHDFFSQITAVVFQLIPTIHSPYKKNNKREYIKTLTFIGAPS